MGTADGLIAVYVLDSVGGGTPGGWDEVRRWTPEQGLLWMHLDYTTDNVNHWLAEESQLSELARDALTAEDVRPRSLFSQDGLLLNLRGVNMTPGAEPEDMVALRLWSDGRRIITSLHRPLLAVDDLRTAIDHGTGPRTVGEFITDLAECMVHRIADVVEDIDDWADRLEEDVLTGERHRIRSELADVRRQAIELRRYLAPQREALGHLQVERVPWLGDLERLQIREVGDRTTRLIEDLDSARERAAVTHEELLSRISEQVERRTYILTMIATIFLPLTFLTGLLGINVSGIPFSEKPWGFALVVALLAVLGGNLWWVLKRKHWW